MKRFSIAGLSAIALVATVSLASEMPVFASWQQAGTAIAQNVKPKGQVQLNLSAEKQVVKADVQGKPKVTWQPLQGEVVVKPGDVLRYTVTGANQSDRPVKNLVVNQAVPQGMVYALGSATASTNSAAKITYSIDKGSSFVEKPMVQVKLPNGKVEMKPAPAEAYTNIRWTFASAVSPKGAVKAMYQVKVR